MGGAADDAVVAAILDRPDLDAAVVPELLDTASALNDAGRTGAAIALLREAARLAPELSLPYQAALQLTLWGDDAIKLAAVPWAAPGLLRTLHGRDAEAIRARTRALAASVADHLAEADRKAAAMALRSRVEAAERTDLSIRISWLGEADLDLRVAEPGGTLCGPTNTRTTGGGQHAGDGFGATGSEPWERYIATRARSGLYVATIDRVWGDVTGKRVAVEITRHAGSPRERVVRREVELAGPRTDVFVTLTGGRRETAADLPPETTDRSDDLDMSATQAGRAAAERFGQAIGGGTPVVAGGGAVVGGNVAAFQPVVELIPEGSLTSVSAVVSADRRYVRLSVSQSFTSIVGVNSFGFVTTGP